MLLGINGIIFLLLSRNKQVKKTGKEKKLWSFYSSGKSSYKPTLTKVYITANFSNK